tara:strand:+ start:216 stop:689 length:474 start_codon:yes stop_codon:yes gene_type:complete
MKHNLKFEIDYDLNFILIGIRSEMKDYQFAYFLNKSPFFELNRMDHDISYILNETKVYFSSFEYCNNDKKRSSFLIKNKVLYNSPAPISKSLFSESVDKTAFLIHELKEFDYLIKMVGIWKKQELKELKKFLHSMKNVEPQENINLTKIKSINNLVF